MSAGEGQQVVALISKRIRALRKKYNRITGMEESISQGKTLNKDQKEVLGSKLIVAALIEELEILLLPPSPPKNQQKKTRKKMADEKDVAAKKDIEDCKISDGLNSGEVSKENTSSACSGSSESVTPSLTSGRSRKSRRKRQSKRPTSN